MSLTYEKTIENQALVQLERANQASEVLNYKTENPNHAELRKIVERISLTEIIS